MNTEHLERSPSPTSQPIDDAEIGELFYCSSDEARQKIVKETEIKAVLHDTSLVLDAKFIISLSVSRKSILSRTKAQATVGRIIKIFDECNNDLSRGMRHHRIR